MSNCKSCGKGEAKWGDPYIPKPEGAKEWNDACDTCGTGTSSIFDGGGGGSCPAEPEETKDPEEGKSCCCCKCSERHADPNDFCPDDNRTILTGEISPYMYCKLQEGKDHRPYLYPERCSTEEERWYRRELLRTLSCDRTTDRCEGTQSGGGCGSCGSCGRSGASVCPATGRASVLPCRSEYAEHAPLEPVATDPSLRDFAVLQYLKPPVRAVAELYDRYPEGGEWGWFAFVTDKETFAYWDARQRTWQLISNYAPEQLLALKNARFRDGDTFVWDASTGRFEIRPVAVYGIEMY